MPDPVAPVTWTASDETRKRALVFLRCRMPEIMAADAALARVAEARAYAADATSSAAQAKHALGPAETALRKAEARLLTCPRKDEKNAKTLHALAESRLREARDTAERTRQEALARKIAVAQVTAEARADAVKPAIRAYANECRRLLEAAGEPWEPPADMQPHPRQRMWEMDKHGRPPKDLDP